MSGLDPLAALAAQAVVNAQAAIDAATLSLGADVATLQAQVNVGDVIAATVLPPQAGTDLLSFLGQTVAAQIPPGIDPGETLLLQVTGFTNSTVTVRNLGTIDPENPIPTVNPDLTPPVTDGPQTAVLSTQVAPAPSAPEPSPAVPVQSAAVPSASVPTALPPVVPPAVRGNCASRGNTRERCAAARDIRCRVGTPELGSQCTRSGSANRRGRCKQRCRGASCGEPRERAGAACRTVGAGGSRNPARCVAAADSAECCTAECCTAECCAAECCAAELPIPSRAADRSTGLEPLRLAASTPSSRGDAASRRAVDARRRIARASGRAGYAGHARGSAFRQHGDAKRHHSVRAARRTTRTNCTGKRGSAAFDAGLRRAL
jgi:hypothetical protein